MSSNRTRGLRQGCGPMLPPIFMLALVGSSAPGWLASLLAAKTVVAALVLFTLSGRIEGFRLPNPSRALRIGLRYEASYWLLGTAVGLAAIFAHETLGIGPGLELTAWCLAPVLFLAGRRACLGSALAAHGAVESGVRPALLRLMVAIEVSFWIACAALLQVLEGMHRSGSTHWLG